MKVYLIYLLILSTFFCCFPLQDQKESFNATNINYMIKNIAQGYKCSTEDHPFMVIIIKKKIPITWNRVCSGTLITESWVLTAASCVSEEDAYYAVLAATSDKINKPTMAFVKTINVHPNYRSRTYLNNIALLKLQQNLKPSSHVGFVELPKPLSDQGRRSILPCNSGLVMGWGRLNNRELPEITALQCAETPIIPIKICQKIFYQYYELKLSENLICTLSERGQGPCAKDNGGPLLCGKVQVGIFSWVFGCGKLTNPAVYIPVAQYLEFIESVMNNSRNPLEVNIFYFIVVWFLIYYFIM